MMVQEKSLHFNVENINVVFIINVHNFLPTKYSFACSSRLEVANVKTLLKFPRLGSSQEKKKPKVESSETQLKDFHRNLTKDG